eukprot:6456763-Amphidinium_carterae.3
MIHTPEAKSNHNCCDPASRPTTQISQSPKLMHDVHCLSHPWQAGHLRDAFSLGSVCSHQHGSRRRQMQLTQSRPVSRHHMLTHQPLKQNAEAIQL